MSWLAAEVWELVSRAVLVLVVLVVLVVFMAVCIPVLGAVLIAAYVLLMGLGYLIQGAVGLL